IERNHSTDSDSGINLTNSGNILLGNTCAGNVTNYELAANNFFGAIVSRVGQLTAAVNGSAAGSSLATTDPHANFSI
ncbi:MAG TPA: hypothetical protein VFF65_02250, partial [Phycisphaerales bacterium]|nr:hypothetical protein [Phycisphaerales bacterium]